MKLLGRRAECEFLDAALADALEGRGRVVVLQGQAGAGKSALLNFVVERAQGWRVATAVGIESEMELAYSGLHQLCASMLDHLDQLPTPQRDALGTVFGLRAGETPDRFLVALATLTLLAEVAEQQPLLCVIDDAQWLDAASAQICLFVGRRLLAERIALVCAARTEVGSEALSGLPELSLTGLDDRDARALLLENLQGPLDAAVCDQIVSESHGNPLALLELPRTWNVADLAGGFGLPARNPVTSKIEQSYAKRLQLLPTKTQLLVLAAAAEPLGDPILLHHAVEILGVGMAAAVPAVDAGLLDVSGRVEFAHPLVRSAAYRSAAADDRQRVHRALAEATDPERDPDRCAWHRARAAPAPDENVAAELERSAGRAQARGGIAAAAAFLERASALSPDSAKRAQRALRAAEAKQLAGAPQAASTLLAIAMDGPLAELASASAQRLKGQIALDLRRGGEATPLLLEAASRLEGVEPTVARTTYLAALFAASFVSEETLRRAAEAARSAPRPVNTPSADDLMLDGLAVRFTDGYAAGASLIKQALRAYRDQDSTTVEDVRWPGIARRIAPDLLDDEAWHDLAIRSAQLARERGALGVLPLALNNLAFMRIFTGELEAATPLLEEADAIASATDGDRITFGRLILAAFRGDESAVSEHVATDKAKAIARGEGLLPTVGQHASALLYNGLGRYDAALSAAEAATKPDAPMTTVWSLPELVEAATHCGKHDLALTALERLAERTQAAGTEWALGIEARSRALLSAGSPAEELYREALNRLGRCRIAPEQGRTHLLYGEWLRRAGRRVDARGQLRTAHEMLSDFGMDGFAECARRELIATGERPRKRSAETRSDLTAQEAQIAQLARDGNSNREIGAQLFLSPRTVEWHMRKVFAKLGISSRKELAAILRKAAVRPGRLAQ
jgi:DNA-binding CsgD family transcriptional regulator